MEKYINQDDTEFQHHNYIWLGISPPSWILPFGYWYIPDRHRAFYRIQMDMLPTFDRVMKELKHKLNPSPLHILHSPHHLLPWLPCIPKSHKYHLKAHHLHTPRTDSNKYRKMREKQTKYAREVEESSREFRRKLEEIQARRAAEKSLKQYMKEQEEEHQKKRRASLENKSMEVVHIPRVTSPVLFEQDHHHHHHHNHHGDSGHRHGHSLERKKKEEEGQVVPANFKLESTDVVRRHKEWTNSRCAHSQDILLINRMTQSIQIM